MGRETLVRFVIGALGCLVLTVGVSSGLVASSPPPPRALVEFLELPSVWGYITEVAAAAGVAAPTVSDLAEAIWERYEEQKRSWAEAHAAISRSLLQEGGRSIVDKAVEVMLKDRPPVDLTGIRFTPPSAGELEKVRITSVEQIEMILC